MCDEVDIMSLDELRSCLYFTPVNHRMLETQTTSSSHVSLAAMSSFLPTCQFFFCVH